MRLLRAAARLHPHQCRHRQQASRGHDRMAWATRCLRSLLQATPQWVVELGAQVTSGQYRDAQLGSPLLMVEVLVAQVTSGQCRDDHLLPLQREAPSAPPRRQGSKARQQSCWCGLAQGALVHVVAENVSRAHAQLA